MRSFSLASLFLAFSMASHAASPDVTVSHDASPQNEVYNDAGELRAPYAAYSHRVSADPLSVSQEVLKAMSESPLGDKVKIYPVPLVLEDAEYEMIRQGTSQRARALRAFFHDLFAGEQTFKNDTRFSKLSDALINSVLRKILPHENLNKMRDFWKGKAITKINFAYGPDLMRANNKWLVVEDNVGVLGGLIDTDWVENAFYNARGLSNLLHHDQTFVGQALAEFLIDNGIQAADVVAFFDKEQISQEKEGVKALTDDEIVSAAWILGNEWFTKADHEDSRLIKVLRSLGVRLADSDDFPALELLKLGHERPQLVFEGDPVGKWAKFIGFYRALRENTLLSHFPSYGTTFLSSKVFLPFIEDFIRFYLNEEPILETVPSRLVTSSEELVEIHEELLDRKGAAYKGKVFKHPDGAQGSNVAILSKMTQDQIRTLGQIIGTQAMMIDTTGVEHFGAPLIIQDELEPSFIPTSKENSWLKLSVDIRPLTLVLGSKIRVRSRPWVRGALQVGHSLNNVSQGAFELAALLVSDCEAAAL